MLRSAEEQYNIISSYASWLKISPVKLQFKSISRRADSDKHIAMVTAELDKEENEQVKRIGQEYLRLIKDVGSKEALSRRFFLVFEYEPLPGRRASNDTYADIYGAIKTAEQNAKTYFSQCGNSILQPDDEDAHTAEILYMFFNRKSCVDEPFQSRVQRVVMDTMTAKGKVIGLDEVPHIRMANFIAPRGIDLTHYNFVIMDGMYYSFLYIRANGYPNKVRAGWMSNLINAGEGIDVDIHLRRENRGKTLDKVAQRIRLNRTKLRSMQDTSTDFEELTGSIQSGYYIKSAIANYNEDLFYMSTIITVSAGTYEELLWRKQQITDMLKSMDMFIHDCNFKQEQALQSVMPFVSMNTNLEQKTKRNILTSGAAGSTYIFTSYEMSDDNGVLLGLNRHNNSLCITDFFNSKQYKNANITILGTTGAGKTYGMQTLALRLRMRGVQCFIIAPLKGHEFKRACANIGGSFIRISPGSNDCINIMEIRQTTTPELDLIDEGAYNEDSALSKKIQQIMIFFSLLMPDMSNEEEQMTDEALLKTYAQFGITHDNNSLYEDEVHTRMKKMPILGDLHKNLLDNPMTKRVATIIGRFVTGSAQSFNQATNVDLANKYVVLDLSELKGKLLPVGMFIALDYVWDVTKSNRTERKMIFLDEIWHLLGAGANSSATGSNKYAAQFCLEVFKIIRGYGGGALAATQDLADFFSLDDGKYGRSILNASKTKIILNLEPDEAAYVQDTLHLTRSEVRAITQFERGEALISCNNNKIPVFIRASKLENELITTDRAELAAMVRERQRQAQANTHDD